MSPITYPCPRCKQPGSLRVEMHWRMLDDGDRHLNRVEMRCTQCDFTKMMHVIMAPSRGPAPYSERRN